MHGAQKPHVCYRVLRMYQQFVFPSQVALRREPADISMLGLRVRIRLTADISLSGECWELSGSCHSDVRFFVYCSPNVCVCVCVCVFVTEFYRPNLTGLYLCVQTFICTLLSGTQLVF